MNALPLVSAILTTRNEERNIANCLQSVKDQSYPRIEVIVVDNHSSDNTVAIAQGFTDRVYIKGPGRCTQQNFGVGEAQGKYILWLDADMMLSRNVVEECVNQCENSGYIGLCIPEKIVGTGFWIKVRAFERSFYDGTCIDVVRFVLRGSFLEIGGLDEANVTFGADDWDFDRRIKEVGKTGTAEFPLYHNEWEFNLRRYLRKKSSYTESINRYVEKWGKGDETVKKQVGANYRLLGVFIENGKWKELVKHPILTLGMYSLRCMVGITYLRRKR